MLKIGEILSQNKLITQEQLSYSLAFKEMNPNEHLGAILKRNGFINDYELANCLSEQIGWKYFKSDFVPDHRAIEEVSLDYFCKHQIFPLKNGGIPSFVVSFVDDTQVTDYLKNRFGNNGVNFYIGAECDVRRALDLIIYERNRKNLLVEIEKLKTEGPDSLPTWLNAIIDYAVLNRATDIHILPTGLTTDVKFRIDSVCDPISCLKPEHIKKIANILLTKCGGNPCDYGCQDGAFHYEYTRMAKNIDVRFSQVPSIHGPKLALRLLDQSCSFVPLEGLGYSEHNRKLITQAITVPHGLTLVTGPTGSGKSTTLSAILNQIKSISKNIFTIEDPVEIYHQLITQIEVDIARGVTFANAIRSLLRQDPDAILIGEIRDEETADLATRAANMGVQIFSTLHTNNPVSALLRLKDLGVGCDKISNSLVAVIAQRLVRKLCPLCKVKHTEFKNRLEIYTAKYLSENVQNVYRADGCKHCHNGYYGRTVVAEVLLIDTEIQDLIGRDAIGEIYSLLRNRGNQRTMIDDAKELVLKGETSISEAVRVLG